RAEFSAEEKKARREVLARSFAAQRDALAKSVCMLARKCGQTSFSRAAIGRALEAILSEFPVYRIYARIRNWSASDRDYLSRAIGKANWDHSVTNCAVLDFLQRCLIGEPLERAQADPSQALAMRRFQQLSAPLCAKAVEDTAFYRYGRL